MFATVINDTKDPNAMGRIATRIAALGLVKGPARDYPRHITQIPVQSDLEAAGNLVDQINAGRGKPGIIYVNVAPRNGEEQKWKNGSPFGYFWFEQTLAVCTISGYTLSLVNKLDLIGDYIREVDCKAFLGLMCRLNFMSEVEAEAALVSQFRSFEILPWIGSWVYSERHAPHRLFPWEKIPSVQGATVWCIDSCGKFEQCNVKTTALAPEDPYSIFHLGQTIQTQNGPVKCYEKLADVPDGERALIIGSSGFGRKRFLEIVIQGGSAADEMGWKLGDKVF